MTVLLIVVQKSQFWVAGVLTLTLWPFHFVTLEPSTQNLTMNMIVCCIQHETAKVISFSIVPQDI
jgi:hypothetical protein